MAVPGDARRPELVMISGRPDRPSTFHRVHRDLHGCGAANRIRRAWSIDRYCTGAVAYRQLAKEFLQRRHEEEPDTPPLGKALAGVVYRPASTPAPS